MTKSMRALLITFVGALATAAVVIAQAAPTLGDASITVDEQIHVGTDSHIFKGGDLLLWEDGDNTGLGRAALASNSTGFANTAIGGSALLFNTTGVFNTAVGRSALKLNDDGERNTAVGGNALTSNVSGSHNTAVGLASLESNYYGQHNTAVGSNALAYNYNASKNTAVGSFALVRNTTGYRNTASGYGALYYNTTGSRNTAVGVSALEGKLNVSTGSINTGIGFLALQNNTTGSLNTAIGAYALTGNNAGLRNIALGPDAGRFNISGSNNIWIANSGFAESNTLRIGAGTGTDFFEQNRAFISGIRGITTQQADAIPVLIDSSGQLGTVSSSRRYKEEIEEMGAVSERLLALRPVTFRYKREFANGEKPVQFGLIAEEVAEAFPELVVYNEEGEPETVKYHLLSSLLLNELQELTQMMEKQARVNEQHARKLAELVALVEGVGGRG